MPTLDKLLTDGVPPVIAILRGITPLEAVPVAEVLVEQGICMIEVPLNSPDPFASIQILQDRFGDTVLIGAGTVLDRASVNTLAATGAKLMVTPNCTPDVIAHGIAQGLEVMPGFLTPTEAFSAINAGARRLKLFPASSIAMSHLKAMRDILPKGTGLWAVGGTGVDTIVEWLNAGAEGIGVGGALYRQGDTPEMVRRNASLLVNAWRCR
jgi:2-dehydro-3-deoxyphosphogalactonate aldolase